MILVGVFVGQYLHSVTQNLALGTELAIQRGHQIEGGQMAILSLCGRYSGRPINKKSWKYFLA